MTINRNNTWGVNTSAAHSKPVQSQFSVDNIIDYCFVPDTSVEEEREYFGIPTLAQQLGQLASDLRWEKQQREKPHAFIGEYDFLSNMYLCTVEVPIVDGYSEFYPSVENAFQAMKCKTAAQRKAFQNIMPMEAKNLGAKVDLRSDWEQKRIMVMRMLLRFKFAQNDELAVKLLKTEDMPLCELNYWGDTFWGKSLVEEKIETDLGDGVTATLTKKKIKGENHLGKLLCEVREELRDSGIYNAYFGNFAEQANVDIEWIGK